MVYRSRSPAQEEVLDKCVQSSPDCEKYTLQSSKWQMQDLMSAVLSSIYIYIVIYR